jgi:hypothetical protein
VHCMTSKSLCCKYYDLGKCVFLFPYVCVCVLVIRQFFELANHFGIVRGIRYYRIPFIVRPSNSQEFEGFNENKSTYVLTIVTSFSIHFIFCFALRASPYGETELRLEWRKTYRIQPSAGNIQR